MEQLISLSPNVNTSINPTITKVLFQYNGLPYYYVYCLVVILNGLHIQLLPYVYCFILIKVFLISQLKQIQ